MTKPRMTPFMKNLIDKKLLTPEKFATLSNLQIEMLRHKTVKKFLEYNALTVSQFDVLLIVTDTRYPYILESSTVLDLIAANRLSPAQAACLKSINEDMISTMHLCGDNRIRKGDKFCPRSMGVSKYFVRTQKLKEFFLRDLIDPKLLKILHANSLFPILDLVGDDILAGKISIKYIYEINDIYGFITLIKKPELLSALHEGLLAPSFVNFYTMGGADSTNIFRAEFNKLSRADQRILATEILDERLLASLGKARLFQLFDRLKDELLQRRISVEYFEECQDAIRFKELLTNESLYQGICNKSIPARFVRVYTSCNIVRQSLVNEESRKWFTDIEFAQCMANFWIHTLFRAKALTLEEIFTVKDAILALYKPSDQISNNTIPNASLFKVKIRTLLEKNPRFSFNVGDHQRVDFPFARACLLESTPLQVEIVKKMPEITGFVLSLLITKKMGYQKSELLQTINSQETSPLKKVHAKILHLNSSNTKEEFYEYLRNYFKIKHVCLTLVKGRYDPGSLLYRAPLDSIICLASQSVPKRAPRKNSSDLSHSSFIEYLMHRSQRQDVEQIQADYDDETKKDHRDIAYAYANEYDTRASKKRTLRHSSNLFMQATGTDSDDSSTQQPKV